MQETRKKKDAIMTTKMSRRGFMGAVGAGVAGLAVVDTAGGKDKHHESLLKGKKLAMVIDMQRCTGCGGCVISCKSENNVQTGSAWAGRICKTIGKFPNVRMEFTPILCNHCANAPCVRSCPTTAMHKGDGGITMHTPSKCIGCRTCIAMCPYDAVFRNNRKPHKFWSEKESIIEGCTSSGAEVTKKVGAKGLPHYNSAKESSAKGMGLRYKGIVEKCTFCDHRVKLGKLPFCVESCPANARIFGDLNDPQSEVSKLLSKYRPWTLKPHLGTEPQVYYIREFNPGNYPTTKGKV